jgi:hypothetical protein
MAWQESTDDPPDNNDIFFNRSLDGGATFGEAASLSDPDRESYDSEVAAFESGVYVVWQEQDPDGNNAVLLRASGDSGVTFGDPVEIASGSMVDPESYPRSRRTATPCTWHGTPRRKSSASTTQGAQT